MAVTGIFGRSAVAAIAMSSVVAGCSSVERPQNMAQGQAVPSETAASPDPAQGQVAVQYNAALPVNAAEAANQQAGAAALAGQTTVALTKTGRLAVPVPTSAETAPVQMAAMASPAMAPIVPFKPQTIATAVQPATSGTAQPLSAQPAAPTQMAMAAPKTGRVISPLIAPAVAAGRIQPAAAEAIALDEVELTPDMVALQSVVPIPRPDRPQVTTLAYASQPKAVTAISAIDHRMEFPPAPGEPMPATATGAPADLNKLIKRYAGMYGVPESLVHRVVHRESKYDPRAYHKNGYWGLMQISYSTAKSMGYQGKPEGLLDAETNLKYAIKYLRGAWLVADNQNDDAIRLYARGYYYDAKRKDMLDKIEGHGPTPVAFATAPTSKPGS